MNAGNYIMVLDEISPELTDLEPPKNSKDAFPHAAVNFGRCGSGSNNVGATVKGLTLYQWCASQPDIVCSPSIPL